MGGMEIALDVALVGLLAATLLQALRLQRMIGIVRDERDSLDDAVAGFDSGARHAEAGVARLHDAAQRLSAEMMKASSLKEDLGALAERGGQVADRLEALVRATRGQAASVGPNAAAAGGSGNAGAAVRSQAERDLLMALRAAR